LLAAQFDAVTALFKEVHSITLYGQGTYIGDPHLKGESNCGFVLSGSLCGVGTEVLIDVGGSEDGTHVELGLGASFLRGLASKDTTLLEFNAGIRSFPTVSAYLIDIGPRRIKPVEVYIGATIGLLELQSAQTYDDSNVERGVTASTFESGLTGGVYGEIRRLPGAALFAEVSYCWRRFASLDYTLSDGDSGRVPSGWPRELDLSGPTLSLGLQFRLKADEDKSLPMLWTLARVDAQPLPAVVEAVSRNDIVTRTELLFGMLRLTPDTVKEKPDTVGAYTLELQSRQVTTNAAGEIVRVQAPGSTPPVLQLETGRYTLSAGRLTLDPGGPADNVRAYPAVHMGDDEIRIHHSASGYGLVFRKPGATPGPKKDDDDDD
jgi:hypothetical protein